MRAFRFDDDNEEKFAGHGITIRQLAQLLENPHATVPNRRHRRATHLLIGRDHGGRAITVPVGPTEHPEVWYPVTAWYSKPSENALLRRVETHE